mmetsp:Transcript_16061/g.39725  ORF Transcript_16061/g.39725 Transcript_16061/m.39725 type:complete len:210 (-) Transcript_16061:457-1086(-)
MRPGEGFPGLVPLVRPLPLELLQLLEQLERLRPHAQQLQLQQNDLAIKAGAAALQCVFGVEFPHALRVVQKFSPELKAELEELLLLRQVLVEEVHRGVEVEQQVRHVLRYPEVLHAVVHRLGAVVRRLLETLVAKRFALQVSRKLRGARVDEFPVGAVKLACVVFKHCFRGEVEGTGRRRPYAREAQCEGSKTRHSPHPPAATCLKVKV